MKRRNFLAGIGPLAAAPLIGFSAETQAEDQQFIEILKYKLPFGENKSRTEKYYAEAAIPALNKMGIENIGVFNVMYGPNAPSLYVVIPHDSMQSVLDYQQKLLDDRAYMEAAGDFMDSSLSSPAYLRLERGLMKAFKNMPKVVSPKPVFGDKRIMEMRIYESHNYLKGQKKIDMFNDAGEITIFKETGLTPVFFGETVFGELMPNLTYMVVFKDMAERDINWAQFVKAPGWTAIKDLPEFKDTVSNITDIILRPASCSQI
ncbi:MAG: NIPSNAP family containing protein [Cyclobacteriaceae bacterium]|nr:NIPSNAP family containing protein [Cyclobacteriaceae bacterium]